MRSLIYSIVCASGVGYVFGVTFGVRSIEMNELQGHLRDMFFLTAWMGITFAILFVPLGLASLAAVNSLAWRATRGTRVWLVAFGVLTGAIAIPFLGFFLFSGVEAAKHTHASSAWHLLPWWIVRVGRWITFSALAAAILAFAARILLVWLLRLNDRAALRPSLLRLFVAVPSLMAGAWLLPPSWLAVRDVTRRAPESGDVAVPSPLAPAAPLVVVGWDGATWDVIRPLLARGELPHLASLMEHGTSSELRTFEPTSSPLIWTTISTGRPPGVHGVRAQVENRFLGMRSWFGFPPTMGFDHLFGPIWERVGLMERVQVTSLARRSQAFWNVADDAGRSVGLVHWRVAWPAERFRGFNVTDRTYDMVMRIAGPDSLVSEGLDPARLRKEMPECIEPPVDVALYNECLTRAIARTEELCRQTGLPRDLAPLHEVFHMEVGLELARKDPVDLFAAYFYKIDDVEHFYWKYREPRFYFGVSEEEVRRYGGAIDQIYRFTDALLGDVLAEAPKESIVLLLSDHGHGAVFGEMQRSGGHAHAPPGVLVMAGPGVKQGAELDAPSVFDVFPTLMYLMGLASESEARGRVLLEAFDDSLRARMPVRTVPSYPPREVAPRELNPNSSIERERIRELKRLGYIG